MDHYDFPFTFRSLTLNRHRSSAGALIVGNEADTIRVTSFDYSRLQQRDQREPLHLLTGGDLGDATIAFRYISLGGMIRASTGAKLDDAITGLLQAFDVEEAQRDSPATEGVAAFGFTGHSETNNGRGTAYTDERGVAGGFYVPEQFLARPAAYPVITGRRSGGDSAVFSAELVCADPRRYCQVPEAVIFNGANGFAGANCPNWINQIAKTVAPVITIVMTGPGNAAFSISFGGASPLVLNLTTLGAGDQISVDCATGLIQWRNAGAWFPFGHIQTSLAQTAFQLIPRGGIVPVLTNTGNISSVTVSYRQARS